MTPDDIRDILALAGATVADARELSRGSASRVWRASTSLGDVVVRVPAPDSRTARNLGFDVALRTELLQRGAAVARPILWSGAVDAETPWIIDGFVAGRHSGRGETPAAVCRDLGRTLSILHEVNATGFGEPRLANGALRGATRSPADALALRFDQPWPISVALDEHEVARRAPDMARSLRSMRSEILDAVANAAPALAHTDLHDRQFLHADGRLAALLDFGEAVIGDASWDLGSLLYFHDDETLAAALVDYRCVRRSRRELTEQARLMALSIACHHITRSRLPGKHHRLAFAASRIRALVAGRSGGARAGRKVGTGFRAKRRDTTRD